MAATVRVGVLAYPGCLGTEVFGLVDLLLFANRIAAATGGDGNQFRVTVTARDGSDVVTAGGVSLRAQPWPQRLDTLVVPASTSGRPGRSAGRSGSGRRRSA